MSSRQGAGCNGVDTVNDSPNYLTLLQELRTALDSNFGAGTKEITLAVRVQPFDVNGGFVTDMSAYAKVVTRFNLMAYGKLFDSLKYHRHDIYDAHDSCSSQISTVAGTRTPDRTLPSTMLLDRQRSP